MGSPIIIHQSLLAKSYPSDIVTKWYKSFNWITNKNHDFHIFTVSFLCFVQTKVCSIRYLPVCFCGNVYRTSVKPPECPWFLFLRRTSPQMKYNDNSEVKKKGAPPDNSVKDGWTTQDQCLSGCFFSATKNLEHPGRHFSSYRLFAKDLPIP